MAADSNINLILEIQMTKPMTNDHNQNALMPMVMNADDDLAM